MERYNNSLPRKHRKPGNRIASGHDKSEQIRELEALQRNFAQRIRTMERIAKGDQAKATG